MNNTHVKTSRVGRKPVIIPAGVEVKIQGDTLSAKGPKGQVSVSLHPLVDVKIEGSEVKVSPHNDKNKIITGSEVKLDKSITGTLRANINNAIQGAEKGFERKLVLMGVGYRAQAKGKVLSLSLGFSHPTEFPVPAGVTIETPSQTEIVIKGNNRELVGETAAKIRRIRPPEPYKGKGIRYENEYVEIKETKKK
jgi:large subunit ribosomal protein L6